MRAGLQRGGGWAGMGPRRGRAGGRPGDWLDMGTHEGEKSDRVGRQEWATPELRPGEVGQEPAC